LEEVTTMTAATRALFWWLMLQVILASGFGGDHPSRPECAGVQMLPCHGTSTSNLPGVFTELHPARCSFTVREATAGLDFPFTVIAETPVSDVVPSLIQPSCGRPDSSGFETSVVVTGNDQRYCPSCDDQGCSDPFPVSRLSLNVGCRQGSVHWEAVNWSGPGSLGAPNPKGAAFSPGDYLVTIYQDGTAGLERTSFEMTASVMVSLTP
jgi:hypothetical protein